MTSSGDEPRATVSDTAGGAGEGGRDASGANLDKVRDILFGTQMREVERRFARLEERLLKETNELRDDVKRRLEALESYARNETGSLADQLRAEQAARVEATGAVARELKETAGLLERRDAALDEQLARGHRELRQQILEQHQRLSDDLRQKVDEVLAALARETGELRADKADRAAIAALLTEVAMRLTDGLTFPGAEDVGRG